MQDIRYALRWLLRSPGFAAVAILSLGLGVGANTAMFSLVDALLLRPLPVENPATLVDVFTSGGDGDVHATTSYPDYLEIRSQNTVFSDTIGYSPMFAALALGDRSRLVLGQVVTANHFDVLGVRPERGRLLRADDDAPGAERVVVLAHRMWVNEFGRAEDVVGRSLRLRGQSYSIVGVAPASFTGVVPLLIPEIWVPSAHIAEIEPAGIIDTVPGPGTTPLDRRGYRWMFVKGRLKDGVSADAARAQLQVIGGRLAAEYPDTNKGRALTAVPTNDVRLFVPEASGPLTIGGAAVMAVVGLVLLIACANVTGLLLARSVARQREIAIRSAIGASRGRIIRQLLVEGVVLGVLGVAVAMAIAWVVTRALVSIELPIASIPFDLRIDTRVFIFAIVAAVASGLIASLSPALRTASPNLVSTLRGPLVQNLGNRRRWGLRELLVSAQMALTIVLLVVAGMLARSLWASNGANVGFETRGLALVSFDTDMVRYSTDRSRQFWDAALARVRELPNVAHASLASPRVPFDLNFNTSEFHVDSQTYAEGQRGPILNTVAVTPDYFATLGVSMLRGRDFLDTDREGAPLVAIVSDAMARAYWPNESAIGKTFTAVSTKRRYEIVGVSADYRVRSVSEPPTPYVHFAAAQRPATYNSILARTIGDADRVVGEIRQLLLGMEPSMVFVNQGTMERTFAATLLPIRVGAWLAACFSLLGTLLAAVGLYGVVAFAVSQRTREIGIRLALGATASDVRKMILRQGMRLVIAGAIAGSVLAALTAAALSSVLYGVGATDPIAWLAALAILIGAAALAHLVPTRRALRVTPATTLRE